MPQVYKLCDKHSVAAVMYFCPIDPHISQRQKRRFIGCGDFGDHVVNNTQLVKEFKKLEKAFHNRVLSTAEKDYFELRNGSQITRQIAVNVGHSKAPASEDQVALFTVHELFKKLCGNVAFNFSDAQCTAQWNSTGNTTFEAWLRHGGWDVQGDTHAKPPPRN